MMLQKKKLLLPKQILAPKNILINKHSDGFAKGIFAKYCVFRNDLAAWFELVFKFDGSYEDYDRADNGQLLINVRMQLQEESKKSSLSILGQQALTNFKGQLENTVKTLYSSAGHQSLKYLNERLLKFNIPSSMFFEMAYNRDIYINRTRFSYIYDNPANIQKAINGFYFNSIKPYQAVRGDLLNALSLNLNTITGGHDLGSVLRVPLKMEINLDKKGINGFNFKSIKPYHAVRRDLKNALSLNLNTITGGRDLGSVLGIPVKMEVNVGKKGKNGFNFNSIKPYHAVWGNLKNALPLNLNTITGGRDIESVLRVPLKMEINLDKKAVNGFYFNSIKPYHAVREDLKNALSLNLNTITGGPDLESVLRIPAKIEINGVDKLHSNIGNYGENYESIIHMNPYNFRNFYRIYFPGLPSYIGAGFKRAYIQGESIKGFSSIIHNKIVAGLRHDLPKVLRSAYSLGLFGVNRTKRKQKRELDSSTREFWHNMTYNIIQGFRRELESKTNYFFTNHIDKRTYGLSPFPEDEGEDEESKRENRASQEAVTHNKYTSIAHYSEQERWQITPHSIYNLRKTYPDIYNMLTFAGLLPTLYVQKHSRETAMGLLNKSIQQYYIGNRNLTARAYDLLRNKLETEAKSFIWPDAMNNPATMEFSSIRKAQKSSNYMAEIQALKTQVVNIEKQTFQSTKTSSVNVNGLVERIYKEIEQRIKVDRVRRGY